MSKPGFLVVCLVGMVILASVCIAAEEPNAFTINKMLGRGVNIGGALDTPTKRG